MLPQGDLSALTQETGRPSWKQDFPCRGEPGQPHGRRGQRHEAVLGGADMVRRRWAEVSNGPKMGMFTLGVPLNGDKIPKVIGEPGDLINPYHTTICVYGSGCSQPFCWDWVFWRGTFFRENVEWIGF